jgi:hypothetical protein
MYVYVCMCMYVCAYVCTYVCMVHIPEHNMASLWLSASFWKVEGKYVFLLKPTSSSSVFCTYTCVCMYVYVCAIKCCMYIHVCVCVLSSICMHLRQIGHPPESHLHACMYGHVRQGACASEQRI